MNNEKPLTKADVTKDMLDKKIVCIDTYDYDYVTLGKAYKITGIYPGLARFGFRITDDVGNFQAVYPEHFKLFEKNNSVTKTKPTIAELQTECHKIAISHGWWDNHRTGAECIALMHSELSEALEWMRKERNAKSDHIAPYTGVEEEFADVIIRILDIEGAILQKIEYNRNRPYKHSGKLF